MPKTAAFGRLRSRGALLASPFAQASVSYQVYYDFNTPGYSVSDYAQKWANTFGPARRLAPRRIAFTRFGGHSWVDYFIDHRLLSQVANVGIPLDKQGVPYTGTYPSLGPGKQLANQINNLQFGHGLFSLLDAFPFQHPESPQLRVSIPVGTSNPLDAGRAHLFGQGATGSFDNFTTLTIGQ